ncbi:MAG TPA: J domain-containing protein [Myxococcaceae bacterium]|nr:J domain-containing protein [Myxococcaceae bacterium]
MDSPAYDPFIDFYRILRVKPEASHAQIKAAYRKLMKEKHPDRNNEDPDSTRAAQTINQAYEVLSDAEARRAYDAARKAAGVNAEPEGELDDQPHPDKRPRSPRARAPRPAAAPLRARRPRDPKTPAGGDPLGAAAALFIQGFLRGLSSR